MAEYAHISSAVSGTLCETDEDCSTYHESYVGTCLRYVWDGTNGSCSVHSTIPIPSAPPQPQLTCADVTCPSVGGVAYQCEVENGTNAVGCVEPRTCREPGTGGGGHHGQGG